MTKNLWQLPVAARAIIVELDARLSHLDAERLADLGFEMGEAVVCLQRTAFGGPATFSLGDSVFSLAREVAEQVTIELVAEAKR